MLAVGKEPLEELLRVHVGPYTLELIESVLMHL